MNSIHLPVAGFPGCFLLSFSIARGQEAIPGQSLPDWKPGYLDLHHINTGGGNTAAA
ncbi:MAG: hypothetical protein ABI813_16015 [Bacteroidota bacterium]